MRFPIRLTQLLTGCLALLACALFTAPAHAGPIELFRNTAQNPTMPDQLVAAYIYGGGGLFVSGDGGKSFGLTCSGATNPDLKFERDISQFAVSGEGNIYVGLFNGLWRGQSNGCGFAEVPELKGHIIGALAVDPIDPNRIYVGTSDGYNADGTPKTNGMWMSDAASKPFTQFGKQDTTWYATLNVIKNGAARRMYATGVVSKTIMDAMGNPASEVHYYVRVSDDEGKTWTDNEYDINQFGPKSSSADFAIVAIDPANPDHVLANVSRDMMPDSFVYSPMQGKAGTWQQIAEVGDLHGVAFAPDGKLYFGDDDQNSRSFYVVDKLGDMPKKLADNWKVSCLRWDASKNRMLACKDWQFGTVDLTSGAFSSMLDMRCAQNFVKCPDESTVKKACEAQLLAAYCGVTHYPLAPLCDGYDQGPDAATFISAQDYMCVNGMVVDKPDDAMSGGSSGVSAGSAGAAGASVPLQSGPPPGSVSAAGTGASSGASGAGTTTPPAANGGTTTPPTTTAPAPKSGCSVSFGERSDGSWLGAGFAALFVVSLARRRRRR